MNLDICLANYFDIHSNLKLCKYYPHVKLYFSEIAYLCSAVSKEIVTY